MTSDETRRIIIDSLHEIALLSDQDRERLLAAQDADVDLASLSIDSLKIVDWCMALESKVKREVQIEELVEHDSINKLARHLASAA